MTAFQSATGQRPGQTEARLIHAKRDVIISIEFCSSIALEPAGRSVKTVRNRTRRRGPFTTTTYTNFDTRFTFYCALYRRRNVPRAKNKGRFQYTNLILNFRSVKGGIPQSDSIGLALRTATGPCSRPNETTDARAKCFSLSGLWHSKQEPAAPY